MQAELTDRAALAADGLSWAIAASRWLRAESAGVEAVELTKEDVDILVAGLRGIQEALSDYLRSPGVLHCRPTEVVPLRRNALLRLIQGGLAANGAAAATRRAEVIGDGGG